MGYAVPPTQANFVWLALGERTADWAAGCAEQRVIVRPFAGEGVRVTIGTPDENDQFLDARSRSSRMSVLLTNIGLLATQDPELGELTDAAIVLSDDRIAWVGPSAGAPAADEQADLDGTGGAARVR